jgi:hypothetical protein
MTRVNRPDTLLTELRELQRRLRLLEGTRMRTATPMVAMNAAEVVPLMPARPSDWPSTDEEDWEPLVDARTMATGTLTIRAVADTSGSVRVMVDGTVAGDELSITSEVARHVVAVPGGVELVVEARSTGAGAVYVQAWLS